MADDDEREMVAVMESMIANNSDCAAFGQEFSDLQKKCDNVAAVAIGKEREYEGYNGDLSSVREQLTFTRRNIEEIVSNIETIKLNADQIVSVKNSLAASEKLSRDKIVVFEGYFEELKAALAMGADWKPEQLEQKNALEKERDYLTGKLDNKKNQVKGVRSDIERICDHIQQLEQSIKTTEDAVVQANKDIKSFEQKAVLGIEKRNGTEKELFDLRAAILAAEEEFARKKLDVNKGDQAKEELEALLEQLKGKMEMYIKEYETLLRVMQSVSSDLEKQKTQNIKIEVDLEEKAKYITEKTEDSRIIRKDIKKTKKLSDFAHEQALQAEKDQLAAEQLRDELEKKQSMITEVDVIQIRKEVESLDKQLATTKAEIEIVRKKHTSSEKQAKAMADLVQLNQNGKRNLLNEMKLIDEEIELRKDNIRLVLIEKERYEHETEVTNQQYYTGLEELKLQELQIKELTKKMVEDQGKLKNKQTLYEAVRSDRNLFSRQLTESQDEIAALKIKFRSVNHRIDQLKDEVTVKDHNIVKEHFMHHSVDKERELLKNELVKIRKQVQSSEGIIENQRVEVIKLIRIIEDAELEKHRQKNELNSVTSERNLLTGQIVKRNYELGVMYDRIKFQRSKLRIGERSFNKLIENLAIWQQQLIRVVQEQNDTIAKLDGFEDLRRRVIAVERSILKEQTKSRALADELEKPMHVHRWRVLESSDPKRFEKIKHIQALQKQLIYKADDITRLDLLIQEKEKIYIELKNILARQPGPEVEEQILIYQQTLKDKVKQLASMEDELLMYREQVEAFRDDIAKIDKGMAKTKKRWLKLMATQKM